jgi:hypothetical protein
MKRTLYKLLATFMTMGLLAGVLAAVAAAHIGASASPTSTTDPDLRSAAIVHVGDKIVRFCFDVGVFNFAGDHGRFHLQGYNDRIQLDGDDIAADTFDARCVRVRFNVGSELDVRQLTIGSVRWNGVTDSAGDPNQQDSASLGCDSAAVGSACNTRTAGGSGKTTAPDLTGATANTSNNTVTYTFDEVIDDDIVLPGPAFGFYRQAGSDDRETGSSATQSGSSVTVSFTDPIGTPRRFFIRNDAVKDEPDDSGSEDESSVQHTGTSPTTDDPDLTSVSRVDDDEYLYTFDEDLTANSDDDVRFFLFEEDGTEYVSDTTVMTGTAGSQRTVRAHFPGIDNLEDFELPLAAATECAVDAEDNGDCSTQGSANAAVSGEAVGHTDAPDLHRAFFDDSFNDVIYEFDEDVNAPATIVASEFCVLDDDANEDCSGTFDSTSASDAQHDSDRVRISFATADVVEDAVAANVHNDSAGDFASADNDNPRAGAGRGTFQTTTTTTTGTATTTTTGTTTTTTTGTGTTTTTTTGTGTTTTTTSPGGTTTTTDGDGPRTRRIATTLTIRYNRKGRAFKGSVGSSRKRCQTQRMVTLLKRGRARGTDTSNRAGNYKINKRRARGRFKTRAARKVFTANNGDTIICQKDTSPTIRVGRRRRR